MNIDMDKKELLAMKLLHYFVTEQNYNPIIVHGIQNEIWLENMDANIRIVRIQLKYIHNKEQMADDNYKVSKLSSQIKLKTFTLKIKTLTLYLDVNEDIDVKSEKNHFKEYVKSEKSFYKKDSITSKYFPDIKDKLVFSEEGVKLYSKINNDIYKKNVEKAVKIDELFKIRKPVITYVLMTIMMLVFAYMSVFGNGTEDISTLYKFGALVKDHNFIRVITSIFIHIGFIHLIMNMWALKILGSDVESFYGHTKYFIIFMYSGIVGNLLSLVLMKESTIAAGASGAIFGVMGSLLYFALNQRTYMQDALKNEIIPVIVVNLIFTFLIPSINMYAHIGGLIGGMLISSALGVKYKTSRFERINGSFASIILVIALIYLAYFI